MMKERDALLLEVCSSPFDANLRGVLADWLEEHDDGEYAVAEQVEFIRLQNELELWGSSQRPRAYGNWNVDCRTMREGTEKVCRKPQPHADDLCEYHRLRRREYELQSLYGDHWALPLAVAFGIPDRPADYPQPGESRYRRYYHLCSEFASQRDAANNRREIRWKFRRGLIEEVSCEVSDWITHGPKVVRSQPVLVVRPKDLELYYSQGLYTLFRGHALQPSAGNIDKDLYDYLKSGREGENLGTRYMDYKSEQDVLDDWSRAAVSWARARHKGLPLLPPLTLE